MSVDTEIEINFQSDGYHDNNERSEEIGQTKIYKGKESLKRHSEALNNSKNWAMFVDTPFGENCLKDEKQCGNEKEDNRRHSKKYKCNGSIKILQRNSC